MSSAGEPVSSRPAPALLRPQGPRGGAKPETGAHPWGANAAGAPVHLSLTDPLSHSPVQLCGCEAASKEALTMEIMQENPDESGARPCPAGGDEAVDRTCREPVGGAGGCAGRVWHWWASRGWWKWWWWR